MHFKKIQNLSNKIIILMIIIVNISCSTLQNISNKHRDIFQGNHLTINDIEKIHIGMTKTEVFQAIGSPTLQDLFEENTWYYIYYHRSHNKTIKQQNFILKFDKNNTLIKLKNDNIQ